MLLNVEEASAFVSKRVIEVYATSLVALVYYWIGLKGLYSGMLRDF